MTMKIFYAFLLSILFIGAPVFAQDQQQGDGHQPPSADDIVSKMQSKLNLTQDQVTAVTPIIEKYATKREDIRQSMEDGTADKDSLRAQMKQLKADEKQELSQVLSEDQLNLWDQMQSQGRHKHSNGGNGGAWRSGEGSSEVNSESNGEGASNGGGSSGSGE